ncbi:MAG: hypothetical protein RMK52_03440 [Chitinophagales bacterium]|nr:hypothetical protein [Chitinophagales bacterium]MDW8393280.1 hypothetical protein [Chitinophagales bacterium]
MVRDFGKSPETFSLQALLAHYRQIPFRDWSGAKWPPHVIHRRLWFAVGGMSEEFSPGMGSDDDLAMKLWLAGCRIFRGIADSRVYHFMRKSTGRANGNNGGRQFLRRYGMKPSTFARYYLKLGDPACPVLSEPSGISFFLKKTCDRILGLF